MPRARVLLLLCFCVVPLVILFPFSMSDARAQGGGRPSAEIVHRINLVRGWHGLGPLRVSRRLGRSARRRSRRMLRRGVFGHLPMRIRASGFRLTGEVVALRRGWRSAPAETVWRWMRSPGHRAILLHPRLRYVGAGRARGRFRNHRSVIWVVGVGAR